MICSFLNDFVNEFEFPNILKQANITPAFKKCYRDSKENYCPVNILPDIPKRFQLVFCKQNVNVVFGRVLVRNTVISVKKIETVDNVQALKVLLTDLLKTFDCLLHELLIAKINAYY